MLSLEDLLNRYLAVFGIEGAGKTEEMLKLALKIANRYKPVLFAYKDYKLLRENRDKLIERYKVKPEHICVCGTNKTYEEALKSYTNPDKPSYMTPKAKYILCTQAVVQRNGHTKFVSAGQHKKGFSAIVIDECDLRMCAIPTLKYQLSRIPDETVKTTTAEEAIYWIKNNYSNADYERLLIANDTDDRYKNFIVADWLASSTSPIVFLTSETLAARFLKSIGFNEIYLKSPDYSDCVVNVHMSKNVVSEFYQVMNEGNYWEELRQKYDLIISDKVIKNNDNEEYTDRLRKEDMFDILNHTVVKGTNNWIGKKILTILSHVPPNVLEEVRDILNNFGDMITDKEVYQLFYRDRLCQAIGRVLGNRGSKETDLLAHESIVKSIMDFDLFPYSFKTFWEIPHSKMDEIWEKTIKLREENKRKRKEKKDKLLEDRMEKTYVELDEILVKKADSYISSSELGKFLNQHNIKSKYGKGNIPVKKVAKHFGVEVKRLTINNLRTLYVVGLAFKTGV